jgi:hypothetical protein
MSTPGCIIVSGPDGKAVPLSAAPTGTLLYTNRLAMDLVERSAAAETLGCRAAAEAPFCATVHWLAAKPAHQCSIAVPVFMASAASP